MQTPQQKKTLQQETTTDRMRIDENRTNFLMLNSLSTNPRPVAAVAGSDSSYPQQQLSKMRSS
jgi:hypothetical protein